MTTQMPKGESGKQLVHMLVEESLLKRVDDFRFKYHLESRTEAFRWLVKAALDQKLAPKEPK